MVDRVYEDSLADADWTKRTWDLPPYGSEEFDAMFPDRAAFRRLPVYAAAVEAGLILDDEWVGDSVEGWKGTGEPPLPEATEDS